MILSRIDWNDVEVLLGWKDQEFLHGLRIVSTLRNTKFVKDFTAPFNNMRTAEVKSNEDWSSQWCTQLKKLRLSLKKNFEALALDGIWSRESHAASVML